MPIIQKLTEQDTSPKELTADQQGETKQDRKIRSVQALKVGTKLRIRADGVKTTGITQRNQRPRGK